jgi:hypothetical protein
MNQALYAHMNNKRKMKKKKICMVTDPRTVASGTTWEPAAWV